MSVVRLNPQAGKDGSPIMVEARDGRYVSATAHDELAAKFKTLVETLHRRTELGKKLARIINDKNCHLINSGLERMANTTLIEWDKETK